MDDIFYQDSLQGDYHKSATSGSWKETDWEHCSQLHETECSYVVGFGCETPDFTCFDDCHDPSCDEPPCTDCDEDVVVCTNAACSPPPDRGPCEGSNPSRSGSSIPPDVLRNTSCAGGVPQDVLRGAEVLNGLVQQSSNDQIHLPDHQFHSLAIDSLSNHGGFPDQTQFFGDGQYSTKGFGGVSNDGVHLANDNVAPRYCSAEDLWIDGSPNSHSHSDGTQCYSVMAQSFMPASLQHRISRPEISMQAYPHVHQHTCASSLLQNRTSVGGSSASSSFSPSSQHAYTFSQVSTPSTGAQTPYQESSQLNTLSYVQKLGPPVIETPADHSEATRCLWVINGEECGQPFANTGALQNHIQEHHTATLKKADGFVCQWSGCSRRQNQATSAGFAQRSKLDRHIQSHTGCKYEALNIASNLTYTRTDKACTCDMRLDDGSICGRDFSTQQSLTLHQRTHTGEKPHKCPHEGCDYAAAQASQLSK
jgi:hypothetical protein